MHLARGQTLRIAHVNHNFRPATRQSRWALIACRFPMTSVIVATSTVVSESRIVSTGRVLIVSGIVPVRVKVQSYERRNVAQDFGGQAPMLSVMDQASLRNHGAPSVGQTAAVNMENNRPMSE